MHRSILYVLAPVLILVFVVLGVYAYSRTHQEEPPVVTITSYLCRGGKSIEAAFSSERVILTLSDTRAFVLPQVQSGSGIRYEKDGVMFVGKGDNAFLEESGEETYVDCVATGSPVGKGDRKQFVDGAGSFSFTYPDTVTVSGGGIGYTQAWMQNASSTGLLLAKATMGASPGPKTNFSDATFTVGTSGDPSAVSGCLTYNPTGGPSVPAITETIQGTAYTVLRSADAGAGNFYETTSYRTIRDNQCYVIEYTIHSTNIENYPPGEAKEFDKAAVVKVMDEIIDSFRFTNGA